MTDNRSLNVGVVGAGSMGRHHARVYSELPDANLVGIADEDHDRAETVATAYGTRALSYGTLLRAVDAVSIAVPTQYHAQVAHEAFDADTHVLIEKPFVDDPDDGEELIAHAREQDLTLQVGHIERFNPAIEALEDIIPEMDVLAVDAQRLGPPIDRENADSVVFDLMIHDIDVFLSLFDVGVTDISAATVEGEPHVSATVRLDNGVLGTLTASRVTRQKVRRLSITGRECRVNVDYLTQSVTIHRHSLPEYVEHEGDVRYRSESIIERPRVSDGEPLKRELDSFVSAVESGTPPEVTGEDGLRALDLTQRIDEEIRGTAVAVAGRPQQ